MKKKQFLAGLLAFTMLLSMMTPTNILAKDEAYIIATAEPVDVVTTNDAFTFVGTWTHSTATGRYGDTYCNGAAGATIEIAFSGEGITFLTTKHGGAGDFKVYVDGAYQGTGSARGSATVLKATAYTAWGLEAGNHVLKIESIGGIEVDAVQVLESDPGLTNSVTVSSAGGAEKIETAGGTLQFNATTNPADKPVQWTVTDATGAATDTASIDENGLLTAQKNGVVLVAASTTDATLKRGTMLIAIRNQALLSEKWDDRDNRLKYSAGWAQWPDVNDYLGTETYSAANGNTCTFSFSGTGFKIYVMRNTPLKEFSVTIDSVVVAESVSTAGALLYQHEAYTNQGLDEGTHEVVLTTTGKITMDAVEITLPPTEIADITAVDAIDDVEVPAGVTFEDLNLPTTLDVTLGEASSTVGVYWERGNYDPMTPGEYTLVGVLLYKADQDNSREIKASVNVTISATDSAAPTITNQPENQNATAPNPAVFTVVATSLDGGEISYQWQKYNGAAWENVTKDGTSASYITPPTIATMDGTKYRCVITNTKLNCTPTAVNTGEATLSVAIDHSRVTVITANSGTVDDIAPAFTYSATGWAAQPSAPRFNGTYRGGSAGATAEIAFNGSGISFLASKHAGAGAFRVYVDGIYRGQGTTFFATEQHRQIAYTVWGLTSGAHTLRIECVGSVEVDAAKVLTANPDEAQTVTINTQPVNQTANEPDAATFTVVATANTADGTAQYQWQKCTNTTWSNIVGATSASYTTSATTIENDNGGKFRCVVTNSKATASVTTVSAEATLTVQIDSSTSKSPAITVQPKDKSVSAQLKATFAVMATSPDGGALTYQWQSLATGESAEWTDIDAAVGATYATPATSEAMSGTKYRCRVTNTKDTLSPKTADSVAATLTVTPAKPQTIALDTATGRLNVNYAEYLSRHDVVYKSPVEEGVNGSTVGNGRIGGMIWNEDGLKMEVTNVDAAPYSCIPSGLVTYRSSPMPKAVSGAFEQRLNLHEGTVTTEYGDGLRFTFMGDPDSELLGIHVEDGRENVTESYVDLSLWLDELNAEPNAPFGGRPYGNPSIVFPNKETWLTPDFTVRDDYVAITRGQEDPNYFGYTIALSVEGADYTTKLVGAGKDKKLRLSVDPGDKEYTIWVANPSRRHAKDHDTLAAAEVMIAKERTYEAVHESFTGFWDEFWNCCFVEYQSDTNSDVDYLENSWYLYQYLIGCGSRGEFPFHFMNGVWRGEERDEGLWSWDYTSFNERTFSYTHFATNRLELTDSYYYMLINNVESGMRYTADRFWKNDKDPRFDPSNPTYIPGSILSPERTTWDGVRQVGYDGQEKGCPYTTHVNATAAEHAMGMYERYEYTGDKNFLKDAYPFIRGVGVYLLNFLKFDPVTQTYYSDNSNALEQYWRVKNPISDLASFPAIMERAILAAKALDVDPELQLLWQNRIDHLALPVIEAGSNGPRYQPHDPPRTPQKNSQNPELDVVWPFNRVGLYQESARGFDFETAKTSYYDRKMPLNIWTPEPIVSARLGLGDDSFQHEIGMIGRSQTRPNGIHADGNGSFESNALVLTAVGEELLQSYNDKIAVFPAVISDPTFRSKFTLLARGGFLVSSEYEDGTVKYVALISQMGGTATVINPWGAGEAVTVRNLTTNETLLQSTTALEFSFETTNGGKYVVEADGRPISSFNVPETITAVRNEGPKVLSKNNRTLGSKGRGAVVPITATTEPVNETNDAFLWSGTWTPVVAGDRFGGKSQSTGTPGSSVDIIFHGKGIEFYVTRRTDCPDFEIYLDGVYQATGSARGVATAKHLAYAVFGLADTTHTLTIRHAGLAGNYLEVDAVKVITADPGYATALTLVSAGNVETVATKGGTLQMTATTTPAGTQVKWTVTNLAGKATTAASVDANGLLTAKTNGQVRITATAADASLKSASMMITISGQESNAKTIDSVVQPSGVDALLDTPFADLVLPAEVTVNLTDGNTAQIPILWMGGNYDGTAPAAYTLVGALLYGASYENPSNVATSIVVTVKRSAVQTEKIDDQDTRIKYTGTANPYTDAGNYMKTQTDVYGPGTATLEFLGTGLKIYAMKNPARGTFTVTIDGGEPVSVTTTGSQAYQHLFYTSPTLTDGAHTMVIRVAGPSKNYVAFDAFEVTLGKQPPAIVSLAETKKAVANGTDFSALGLPATVEAVLENGEKVAASVAWDAAGYEPNRASKQRITGQVAGKGLSYSNPGAHYAVAEVTVAAGESPYTIAFTGGLDVVGSAPIQEATKAGGTFKLPENHYAKEGFRFGGWYDGSKVYQPGELYTMSARNVLFTAKWQPTLTAEYTITYTGGADAAGTAPGVKTVKSGTLLALLANPFDKTGYRFAGWYDGSNVYNAGATYAMPARDIIFMAQWQSTATVAYPVTFTKGGDGVVGDVPTQAETEAGRTFAIPSNGLTLDGFVFMGWYDGSKIHQPGDLYSMPAQNVIFTAKWEKDLTGFYTVTFKGGYGATGAAPTLENTKVGSTFTLPANTFAKKDAVFAGWGDGGKTCQPGDTYTMPARNITFTAQWAGSAPNPNPNPGTGNGGGGGAVTPSEKKETVAITPEATSKDGTAEVIISGNAADKLVSDAKKNASGTVVIEPVIQGESTKTSITLPSGMAEKLAKETKADLTIKTPQGSVTIANEHLGKSSIALTISLENKADGSISIITGSNAQLRVIVPAVQGNVVAIIRADGTTEILPKSYLKDGSAWANLPGDAVIKVIENNKTFADVAPGDWFTSGVRFASSHELFGGVGGDAFAPMGTMTRGMMVTVLHRLENRPLAATSAGYADVPADAWYGGAVSWASEAGIAGGQSAAAFLPESHISRQELAQMLYHYAKILGADTSVDAKSIEDFSDGAQVSPWAKEAMNYAVTAGLLAGKDSGALDPNGNATRAEVATILQRFVERHF